MEQSNRKLSAQELYGRYGKPLEAEHRGEYLAVSPKGETLLAPSVTEALEQATKSFGRGNFIFKVGERAVGSWR